MGEVAHSVTHNMIFMNLGHKEEVKDEAWNEEVHSINSRKSAILLRSALFGDWKAAEKLFLKDENLLEMEITEDGDTCLHVACRAGNEHFVDKFLDLAYRTGRLPVLTRKNKNGYDSVEVAVTTGSLKVLKRLLVVLDEWPNIRPLQLPIQIAVDSGHEKMAEFLFPRVLLMRENDLRLLFASAIRSRFYEFAFELLQSHASLASVRCDDGDRDSGSVLQIVVREPLQHTYGLLKTTSQEEFALPLIKLLLAEISKLEMSMINVLMKKSIMFDAIRIGNTEVVSEIVKYFPHLLSVSDDNGYYPLYAAVEARNEETFKLLKKFGGAEEALIKSVKVGVEGETVLHKCAKVSRDLVNGAWEPFLLSRDIRWFREVERIVPTLSLKKDSKGKFPYMIFEEEHEEMRKRAADSMRGVLLGFMLVCGFMSLATFGARVMYSSDPSKEVKVFQNIFATATSCSLMSSLSALLIFISMIVSRFDYAAFSTFLPKKFAWGLAALSLAIISLLVSYVSIIQLSIGGKAWIITTVFCSLPSIAAVKRIFSHVREVCC